ncbi:uncharacterized protein LOC127718961 isoform X2 [Mytilus californianus]|uniref:uncharacterized protein LOC127718961 isoform X2 n=1 Tax=Mytilus californianus TaxID=6549 RepID=UPI0022453A91|nr:uncharacterized protein LOC127718961 isoform X2 [Mytilus californianus]
MSPVDLSRLFLQTHMAHFTAFDNSCDSSALLGIIVNIGKFPAVVESDARKIRSDVQNPWTHWDFTEWTSIRYRDSFQSMRHLISNLRLSNREENKIQCDLHSWAGKGDYFVRGIKLDYEVVKEISQQTHVLSEYVQTLCTKTESQFITKLQIKLKDLENDLQESITTEHGKEITQHDQEISEWEQDQTTFVKIRATRHILKYLPLNNCIVVIGSSGCGKSSNIHHAALHLRDRYEYEIVPVLTGPTDIINYYNENKNQAFVVDDICGKETINMQALQMWRDYSTKIEKIFEMAEKGVKNKTDAIVSKVSGPKLIVSCRPHIYKESQLQLFTWLSRMECNLSSEKWGLLKDEKMFIANMYFSNDITDKINVTQVMEEVDFFPLFCKCSEYKSSEEVIKPFTAQVDTITKNVYHIVHTHKEQFCALVLCILFENGFNIDWLELYLASQNMELYLASQNMKDKLRDILKEFDIDFSKEMYRKSLRFGFSSLNGTFLKRRGTHYKMIHEKMHQLAAVICGQHLTECFIKYAPIIFIRDQFIFESISKGKASDYLILLSEDKEENYFERLLKDLKEYVITSTFHNKQLTYQSFIHKLIGFFGRNNKAITLLRTLDTEGCETKGVDYYETFRTTPLIESASGGYSDIVHFLIAIIKSNVENEDGRGRTSLYRAAEGGNINVVKLLLEKNADVLHCNYDKESPLYVACKGGHQTTVELFLQNDANVLQCDNDEKSPLYVACEGGHKDIVEMLLNYKVDIFKCNYEERSPLFVACVGGRIDIVELLLQNNADISKCNNEEKSPLYVACEKGHANIVELLLQNNADISKCNNEEKSPLYVACEGGHADIVELLLQNNADVSKCNYEEKSPLFVACEGGHTIIVELLLQNNADISKCNYEEKSPLFVACEGGHKDIVKLLLQNNADISKCDDQKKSPLHMTCEGGHTYIVELLLQKNADVSQSDDEEKLSLFAACEGGHIDIVKLLLHYKADISRWNYEEKSPLFVACEGGHTDILELLLQNNADISKSNYEEKSPLYVACEKGHADIVELLLQNNADISKSNYKEKSPLYVACEAGYTYIVKLLLQNNADVYACDYEKKLSMYVACERGHINIVKLLLQNTVDVSMYCDRWSRRSLLYVASESGHQNIVALLIQNDFDKYVQH